MDVTIDGRTAGDIAASVRALVDGGALAPGDPLPPVRTLAAQLGVNRNTVVAAYRQLAQAGAVVTRGRAGTRVAGADHLPEEGFARDAVLRDVGSGNPDPRLLPDPAAVRVPPAAPVLYGQSTLDPALATWATDHVTADCPRELRVSVTGGAVDGVERLLATTLAPGDLVALEDPCYLTSISTVRRAGYLPVPVTVDAEGMTVDGLRAALTAGARAVVCTPRAHNPTGASLSERRAAALRRVLAPHPNVLVVEDDHFSLLSRSPYRSVVGPRHARWAVVRSVSKFLGPDLRLAYVASDPETAERLAARLGPGTTWVSHLLQRTAAALLTDPATHDLLARARDRYAHRNAAFVDLLASRGLAATAPDGLNVWVALPAPSSDVTARLMRRGWLARDGADFALERRVPRAPHLRLTVHDLDDDDAVRLADDLAAATRPAGRPSR
ncbi:aminotransferase class I/II-fold pyridoxal phosphate-dependent enzyme [Cellulomonas sp. HD19AZ1]|uniref:aminotransferase class I/II-fold pyridoxal phosphate-dependent enzyme n=1 Tax=Cellulomonas sp. HD19AZ1 TaxID=2559593 RepID=UPI001070ACF3|nr:aminotransferase class I/II-fold pyridoxal phosphate-dependent enzyme [Cellulomonas sp. HD19AZ1]TFH71909.1 aminotransferase class I/II-fold pyridoxal phosphate-dependent enzyme [Cellulomonas sp. HD19AZ1]